MLLEDVSDIREVPKKKQDDENSLEEKKVNTEKAKETLMISEMCDNLILKDIIIEKNLHLRVIENDNGRFVEFRKFYKDYPTKRSFRVSFNKFTKLVELIYKK